MSLTNQIRDNDITNGYKELSSKNQKVFAEQFLRFKLANIVKRPIESVQCVPITKSETSEHRMRLAYCNSEHPFLLTVDDLSCYGWIDDDGFCFRYLPNRYQTAVRKDDMDKVCGEGYVSWNFYDPETLRLTLQTEDKLAQRCDADAAGVRRRVKVSLGVGMIATLVVGAIVTSLCVMTNADNALWAMIIFPFVALLTASMIAYDIYPTTWLKDSLYDAHKPESTPQGVLGGEEFQHYLLNLEQQALSETPQQSTLTQEA